MRPKLSVKKVLIFNFVLAGIFPVFVVVLILPYETASPFIDRISVFSWIAGLGISILIALAMATISLRKILHPFPRLISDARKIAEGKYPLANQPASYQEMDPLFDNTLFGDNI